MSLDTPETDQSLLRQLEQIRASVRRRLVVYGGCAVFAGAIAGLLLLIVLDWWFWLPAALRVINLLVLLVALTWAAMRWIVRPLRAPISLGDIAGRLERRFGDLSDRLSSAVSFLQSQALGTLDEPNRLGSPQLVRAVIRHTEAQARTVNFRKALAMRPTIHAAFMALIGAGVFCLASARMPDFMTVGLNRCIYPFTSLTWPKEVEILPWNRDLWVAMGESVSVEMSLVRGGDDVRPVLHLVNPSGSHSRFAMQRRPDGAFEYTIDGVVTDLRYWFEAGDDSTRDRLAMIHAVRRPALVQPEAIITPPAYVGAREPLSVPLDDNPISAVESSSVRVRVGSSKMLGRDSSGRLSASLAFEDGSAVLMTPDEGSDTDFTGDFILEGKKSFQVEMVDPMGLDNRPRRTFLIQAVHDAPPRVVVVEPAAVVEAMPGAVIDLQARAEDDFGLASISLNGSVRDKAGSEFTISLMGAVAGHAENGRFTATVDYAWDLAALRLAAGDVVLCQLEAADGLPADRGGPNVGRSELVQVKVIGAGEFIEGLREELLLLRRKTRQLLSDQELIKDQADALLADLPERDGLDRGDLDAVVRLGGDEHRLASQTDELGQRVGKIARRMQSNRVDDPQSLARIQSIAAQLEGAAAGAMAAAAQQLQAVPATGSAAGRQEALSAAGQHADQAIAGLKRVLQDMDQWGDAADVVTKARELLDRQQQITARTQGLSRATAGKKPDDLEPGELRQLVAEARRQRQLAEEADQLVRRLDRVADGLRESDPGVAEALERAARSMAGASVSQRMNDAAEKIDANRLSAAGIDQTAAEAGLTGMLREIQEQQRRELDELTKRLERAVDAMTGLIERQKELITVTREARDAGADEPVWADIANDQSDLRRSVRQFAGELEASGETAFAGRVTHRAAGRMDRAVDKLAAAETETAEAEQSAALGFLEEALVLLREIAARTADELRKRDLGRLQEQIAAIRDRQQEVNGALQKVVDQLSSGGDGLPRTLVRKMSRLADEQDVIEKSTAEVREQVKQAAVFNWLLEQASEGMTFVRTQLDRRTADGSTVARADDVVKNLNRLIDGLVFAVNLPMSDDYAEPGGEGGGAGAGLDSGASPIPTVAELSVLKDLQEDINRRTREMARTFDADAADEAVLQRLRELGQSQARLRDLTKDIVRKASARP